MTQETAPTTQTTEGIGEAPHRMGFVESMKQTFFGDPQESFRKYFQLDEPLIGDGSGKLVVDNGPPMTASYFMGFDKLFLSGKEKIHGSRVNHMVPYTDILRMSQLTKKKRTMGLLHPDSAPEFMRDPGAKMNALEIVDRNGKTYHLYGLKNHYNRMTNLTFFAWQSALGRTPVRIPKYPLDVATEGYQRQGVPGEGVQQGSHQGVQQGYQQGHQQGQGVPQGTQQGYQQGQGVPQGVQQGYQQGQGIPPGVQQGVPQGVQQGYQQGQGVPQGVQSGYHQGVAQGVQQGVQQGLPTKDPGVPITSTVEAMGGQT